MDAATGQRRLRADAARNRQALIDAAQRLLADRGMGVTLDDIAREAGVNVATAYRHFANKHELVAAFMEQTVARVQELARQAAAADDPWVGLSTFLREVLDLLVANRGLHDVLVPGMAGEWLTRLDRCVQPVVARLLRRAQRTGAVRRDLQVGDLGVLLQMLATVSDVAVADRQQLLRRYLTLVLDALRPSPTRLPGDSPSTAAVWGAGSGRGSRR